MTIETAVTIAGEIPLTIDRTFEEKGQLNPSLEVDMAEKIVLLTLLTDLKRLNKK